MCLTHLCCSRSGLAVLSRAAAGNVLGTPTGSYGAPTGGAAAGGPGMGSGEESWTFRREPDSPSRVQERDMMETHPLG